jgi:hypothetical protein
MNEETIYPEYLPMSSGRGAIYYISLFVSWLITFMSSIRKVKKGIKTVIIKVLQKTIELATNNLSNGSGVIASSRI